MKPSVQKIIAKLNKQDKIEVNLFATEKILASIRKDESEVDSRLQNISDLKSKIFQEEQKLKILKRNFDKYLLELLDASARIDKASKEMRDLGIETSNLIPYRAEIKRGQKIISKLERLLNDIK